MTDITTSGRRLAQRASLLGGEGVFTSAAEANAAAAAGQKVYPFHLGNVGFATPQNIVEAMNKAVRDGHTGYCQNEGIPELREAIAWDVGRARDLHYGVENVAVQPGGKPVIGKFLLALMEPGDEVLYPNPGFPIYSSLIGHFGGRPVPYTYRETSAGFGIDLEGLERAITARTRLLILNDPHNPSGAECTPEQLERIAELVLEHDLMVLCDEAYFDVRLDGGTSRSLASLPGMQERCVILFTFAKRYAMGGWRLGAAIGPQARDRRDRHAQHELRVLHQHLRAVGRRRGPHGRPERRQEDPRSAARAARYRRADPRLHRGHHLPQAGDHVLSVSQRHRRDEDVGVGLADYETFRRAVLKETGVSMCTRAQFGDPLPGEEQCYLRFSYSGIDGAQIEEGLTMLKRQSRVGSDVPAGERY